VIRYKTQAMQVSEIVQEVYARDLRIDTNQSHQSHSFTQCLLSFTIQPTKTEKGEIDIHCSLQLVQSQFQVQHALFFEKVQLVLVRKSGRGYPYVTRFDSQGMAMFPGLFRRSYSFFLAVSI